MAISLKNVDDRLTALETHKMKNIAMLIGDKTVDITKAKPHSITSNAFRNGALCYLDWTLADQGIFEQYKTAVIPLDVLRTGKVFLASDAYGAGYQGIRVELAENKLTIYSHCRAEDGNNLIHVRWLAVFKYYLNTVLGWVM